MDGRRFAVTWDEPGWHEGIGLYEDALIGTLVSPTADAAIWDVSQERHLAPLIGKRVDWVNLLRYRPWSDDGELWCPHISIRIAGIDVEVIMGDAENGALVPSADCVAVLFPPTRAPKWPSLS